ncbi:MAG: efflux RND transporter permease subunit, partial [bacterium]|nr:efflux RND transporter permease subunit [bacterium]
EFKQPDEIKNVIIGSSRGIPVYLKDVADVKDTFKEENMIVHVNGENGLMVMIQKQSSANTVQVVNRIKKKLETIRKTLPDDVSVMVNMDTAQIVKDSINNLSSSILLGGLFVVLTIMLLLMDWKAGFIISLTIPFSLIVAFIFLYFFGYTINIMSLSSLAIAIGMVVDNAIVVTENIFRLRFEEKMDIKTASIKGASQVAAPVMASTLTTIVIFFPVLFISGIVAILFKQLALSIVIVLLASLFVSLFLTPSISSLMLGDKPKHKFWIQASRINEKIMNKIKCEYRTFLAKALLHKRNTMIISAAIFILTLFLLMFIGKEFMPEQDQGVIQGTVELENNTPLSQGELVQKRIEQIIEKTIPEKTLYTVRVGKSSSGFGSFMSQGNNIIQLIVRLKPKSKRRQSGKEIALQVTRELEKIPGVKEIVLQTSSGMSMGNSKPISLEIYGYDLDMSMNFAKKIKSIMARVKGINNITISRKTGKSEIQLDVDRIKAQNLGLSLYQIANTVKNSFAGKTATRYREAGDEYDVFIRLRPEDRNALANVKNTLIKTPSGKFVSVENLAQITIKSGPRTITRKNKERYLTVDSEIYGRSLSEVVNDLEAELKKIAVPSGIRYEFSGTAKDQREAFGLLFQALFLGIVLVYLVMAAQFESFIDPFIIMFSVPFAITGVFWALFLTGVTLNIYSFIGIIMLVGIVVNNAIILIDVINQLRRTEGYDLTEAILTGCSMRLRPIMMTTITTLLGVLPMALSRGEGAEQWVPLGVSLFGGLLVSTLITLILVPAIYYIFERRKAAKQHKEGHISLAPAR